MKKLLHVLVIFCMLNACTDFSMKNQGFPNLVSLPESVSFNGDGDAINADQEGTEGGEIEIEVEAPNGTLKDIAVTYSLGGTATFGDDYTIDGATASSGTVTIKPDISDVNNLDKGTITVKLLIDVNDDGGEQIILTLMSATREGENVAVGRGGTEHGKTATVTIVNKKIFLTFSKVSITTYESDPLEQIFTINLNAALGVDVNYDFTSTAFGLDNPANYTFSAGSVQPGAGLAIKAGETTDSVKIKIVDNTVRSTSATNADSVLFYISNARTTSNDPIAVGLNTRDTLSFKVNDDIKEYGLNLSSSSSNIIVEQDTVVLNKLGVYLFNVNLKDTLSGFNAPTVEAMDISYTLTGTAIAGTDYDDVSSGVVSIPQGESSADIIVKILRVGADLPPTLTLALGDAATTDMEILGGAEGNDSLNIKIQ